MNAVATKPKGFTLNDRGGRVRVHSNKGSGTILVFKGTKRPKRVHF